MAFNFCCCFECTCTAVGRVWIKCGEGGKFRQILKKKKILFAFKGYTCRFKSEAFAPFASIALRPWPDEGYSRNASFIPSLIYTFLLDVYERFFIWCIKSEWVGDCCLTPNGHIFFSQLNIMLRISYIKWNDAHVRFVLDKHA